VVLRRRHDGGFTLVELLISVTILGILIAAIANAMFVALHATVSANDRLTESNDALVAATYFDDDVQGAQSVSVGTTANCGSAACSAFVQVNLTVREQSGNYVYTLTGRRRTTP